MKNLKMWIFAIVINLVLIFITVQSNEADKGRSMSIRLGYLIMPFMVSAFNFLIAIFINTYNAVKGEKFRGHPFFLMSLLALLVGLGICSLRK
jgi:hypothetical protein